MAPPDCCPSAVPPGREATDNLPARAPVTPKPGAALGGLPLESTGPSFFSPCRLKLYSQPGFLPLLSLPLGTRLALCGDRPGDAFERMLGAILRFMVYSLESIWFTPWNQSVVALPPRWAARSLGAGVGTPLFRLPRPSGFWHGRGPAGEQSRAVTTY